MRGAEQTLKTVGEDDARGEGGHDATGTWEEIPTTVSVSLEILFLRGGDEDVCQPSTY